MNEVEKMYENANIDYEDRYNDCTLDMEGECHLNIHCDLCNYSKEKYIYPTFTAEKQLSLIIFLSYKYGKGLLINLRTMDKDVDIYDFELFGECLAKLVNELWQDLTDAEKQKVKGILE